MADTNTTYLVGISTDGTLPTSFLSAVSDIYVTNSNIGNALEFATQDMAIQFCIYANSHDDIESEKTRYKVYVSTSTIEEVSNNA